MRDKSCLILDSDAEHAASLVELVGSLGFDASVLQSLSAVDASLDASRPDLAFLAMEVEDGESLSLIADYRLSHTEIIVMGDSDEPSRAEKAMELGASYFFCKPFDEEFLRETITDLAGELEEVTEPDTDCDLPCVMDQFGYLRGNSRSMRKLYRFLRKVGPTEASVLLVGESGTGKELAAKTLHMLSSRDSMPFLAFNCAELSKELVESELFGHEKGSFSGASRRHLGFFERANGGTLLLDEVTEMDFDLQAKFLRVLETRSVRRVGSELDLPVDVRIISSTNRNPDQAVADGILREDLYYRLAQIAVTLPPLRTRGSDVTGLAKYFLNQLNEMHDTTTVFEPAALEEIARGQWPGNVRQLKHAVERAYILSGSRIKASALSDSEEGIARQSEAPSAEGAIEVPLGRSLADSEEQIIIATLKKNNGNKNQTAEELGISLKTLYNRLNEYEQNQVTE